MRAFLVRSGASALLIDTGNQDSLLKAALARQRVGRLDAVGAASMGTQEPCSEARALTTAESGAHARAAAPMSPGAAAGARHASSTGHGRDGTVRALGQPP